MRIAGAFALTAFLATTFFTATFSVAATFLTTAFLATAVLAEGFVLLAAPALVHLVVVGNFEQHAAMSMLLESKDFKAKISATGRRKVDHSR
ncbi:hypothetical protein AYM40_12140 [Paraburkholderia phytofirmans OLGA172]|uniref:Uncharacterized protein n=1 Tax=Paraburkholderia phytofirmans OLGA172 TaxID=1417228 RepID=A0A160FKQ1_9BURK|nr:hypothetical protein AYM40_12140 [Paraburkholderia phytofirmans OLGA172]